jgi:hypothetical protein
MHDACSAAPWNFPAMHERHALLPGFTWKWPTPQMMQLDWAFFAWY